MLRPFHSRRGARQNENVRFTSPLWYAKIDSLYDHLVLRVPQKSRTVNFSPPGVLTVGQTLCSTKLVTYSFTSEKTFVVHIVMLLRRFIDLSRGVTRLFKVSQ